MATESLEDKRAFVAELDEYLDTTNQKLNNFITNLGWSTEYLLEQPKISMSTCPFNAGHIVPSSSLEKHKEYCSWKHEGYSKEDMESALPSSHFFYQNSTSVVPILIDKSLQTKILKEAAQKPDSRIGISSIEKNVPKTMDRAMTCLSPGERLAIYEYVIDKMKQINKESAVKIEDLQFNLDGQKDGNQNKPKSHLELMAEQRDYKRRRQSYRAKNVHITKKSYTEVMRDVIQNQMGLIFGEQTEEIEIEEKIKEEDVCVKKEDESYHERHSSRSRYDSGDLIEKSSTRKKHKRERSEERERKHHHKHHKHKKSKHHKHKHSSRD